MGLVFYFPKLKVVYVSRVLFSRRVYIWAGTICLLCLVEQDLTVTVLADANPSHSVIGRLHYILWTHSLTDLDACTRKSARSLMQKLQDLYASIPPDCRGTCPQNIEKMVMLNLGNGNPPEMLTKQTLL